jgi:hypothetical protein
MMAHLLLEVDIVGWIHHLHTARLIRLSIHDADPTSQTWEHTLSG